ncbi:MAG: alpha/beta fold hydrolase [Candidatus Buchananbacteria bacterium]
MVDKILGILEKYTGKPSAKGNVDFLKFKNIINKDKTIYLPQGSEVGILLLHGFTSTPFEFCDLAKYLSEKGLTVYAPKIAGHGTTPSDLAKTTIAEWQKSAEEAFSFLESQTKKIFVIGSSFGGNLAIHLAEKFESNLAGFVSIGTPIQIRWQRLAKIRLYTYGLLIKNYKKRGNNYKFSYTEQAEVVYPVIPTASLKKLFSLIKNFTIPSLKKITAPALIIHSNSDAVVHPKSAQYLHEKLGSENKRILWIDGCGHSIALDEKRWLIYKAIYRFICDIE